MNIIHLPEKPILFLLVKGMTAAERRKGIIPGPAEGGRIVWHNRHRPTSGHVAKRLPPLCCLLSSVAFNGVSFDAHAPRCLGGGFAPFYCRLFAGWLLAE